jgi:hypothetical protein
MPLSAGLVFQGERTASYKYRSLTPTERCLQRFTDEVYSVVSFLRKNT